MFHAIGIFALALHDYDRQHATHWRPSENIHDSPLVGRHQTIADGEKVKQRMLTTKIIQGPASSEPSKRGPLRRRRNGPTIASPIGREDAQS